MLTLRRAVVAAVPVAAVVGFAACGGGEDAGGGTPGREELLAVACSAPYTPFKIERLPTGEVRLVSNDPKCMMRRARIAAESGGMDTTRQALRVVDMFKDDTGGMDTTRTRIFSSQVDSVVVFVRR